MVETTSIHPVAFVAIVGPLVAFSICRYAIAGPHPAQARCPGINSSGFSAMSLVVNFHSDILLHSLLSYSYELDWIFDSFCAEYFF